RPVNKYVAGFIGSPAMNLIPGQLDAGRQHFDTGRGMAYSVQGYDFSSAPVSGPVWLGLRPEHVQAGALAQSQPVQVDAYVDMVEPMGSDTQVWAKVGEGRAVPHGRAGPSGHRRYNPHRVRPCPPVTV
ncbi:TOBE domain-containing protein, partial [Ralstonia pseudosolanacearum]|uniref:TOBE domain-containing protein n=1 Tax=Ralstonia pseudosolanacearum TaxID=1310165 RepID=UPI003CF319F9